MTIIKFILIAFCYWLLFCLFDQAWKKCVWRVLRTIIAWLHLNGRIVCEESRGVADFHDWMDGDDKSGRVDHAGTMHFYTYTCRRCGKEFTI